MQSRAAAAPGPRPPDSLYGIAFFPDGRTLASVGDGSIRLWDLAAGRETASWVADGWVVKVSPDGSTVAAASQSGDVTLWDPASGRSRAALSGQGVTVRSVAFSPDGRTLATACHDGTVRLWDAVLGQEKATLQLNAGPVRSVAVSPGGGMLAAGAADGTVRIWQASADPQAKACRAQGDTDDPAAAPASARP